MLVACGSLTTSEPAGDGSPGRSEETASARGVNEITPRTQPGILPVSTNKSGKRFWQAYYQAYVKGFPFYVYRTTFTAVMKTFPNDLILDRSNNIFKPSGDCC